jgi:hypothetical protein
MAPNTNAHGLTLTLGQADHLLLRIMIAEPAVAEHYSTGWPRCKSGLATDAALR